MESNMWMIIYCQANDQLRRWFVDDDALERSLNGEYVLCALWIFSWQIFLRMQLLSHCPSSLFCRWFLLPFGNEAVASEPISLSRDENKPCVVGYVYGFYLIAINQFKLWGKIHQYCATIQHDISCGVLFFLFFFFFFCNCRSVSQEDFPGTSIVILAPQVIPAWYAYRVFVFPLET